MPDDGRPVAIDWSAIERSPEFRELTTGRRRFAARAGALGLGLGLLYIVLAGVAPGLMGTEVAGVGSLSFLGGILVILLTWTITIAYMRRSRTVWAPLEQRIRDAAKGRDTAVGEPGAAEPAEVSR